MNSYNEYIRMAFEKLSAYYLLNMTFSFPSSFNKTIYIAFRHIVSSFQQGGKQRKSNDPHENYDLRLLIKVGTSFLENRSKRLNFCRNQNHRCKLLFTIRSKHKDSES